MQIVLLIARLLLALVFGVAAISKIADVEGSRRAMIGFGAPERLAPMMAVLLPIAEIVIAVAVIPLQFAWIGSIAAFVALAVFAAVIAVNLVRGRAPECHCFGQLHSKPVGGSTLIRNMVLMAAAGLVIVQGNGNSGASALSWLANLQTSEIVSLGLATVTVALLVPGVVYVRRILNQQAAMLARIEAMKKVIDEDYAEPPVERAEAAAPAEGLPVGAPAPGFALAAVDGAEQTTLDDLLAYGKPVLLLFVSSNCAPCKAVLESVGSWERKYGKQLTILLLGKGTLQENQELLAKHGATNFLLQGESGVAEEYQAKWSPAAVLIRPDGKIASHVVYGDEAIRAMVARIFAPTDDTRKRSLEIKGNGHKPQIIIGTPHSLSDVGKLAPEFSLPDAYGNMLDSKDLIVGDTLLLFWDPKCPFCKSISEDIRRWEEYPPVRAPRLVFVSMGELEEVQAESARFKSQFLSDPELDVGALFGTNLTPSAVLIDAQGRIASGPEAGRPNILALAGAPREVLMASSK